MKLTKILLTFSASVFAEETIDIQSNQEIDIIDSQIIAAELAKSTPGGASVISIDDSSIGNAYNTAEILAFTPGVYAKAGSVQLDARLAVRGGGATRRFGNRGVTLLIDGVPANIADGSFYTRGYDGSNISYVEAYRGANGLARGSQSLGGSINFAQKNGLTDPGTTLFVEGGSFNLFRTGASSGFSEGKVDAFVNFSTGSSDGFREFQGWEQTFTNANIGYQWNDNAASRFYVSHVNSDIQLAGGITFAQFEQDPTIGRQNQNQEDRDVNLTRVAQKTTFDLGQTQAEFHTFYQRTDFDHLISGNPAPASLRLVDFESDDFGLGLRTTSEFKNFNLRTDNAITYGELVNAGITPQFGGGPPRSGQEDTDDTFFNLKLYGEAEYFLNQRFSLFSGLGLAFANRQREVNAGDTTSNADFDANYLEFLPRFGFLYRASDAISLYGNYSRSFEAPASSEASIAAPADALAAVADSIELGARIENDQLSGEISAFYSLVNNEFLNDGNGITQPNADAVYSGVELAGSAVLFGEGFGKTGLFLDLNYIYSNYFFSNGIDQGLSLEGNNIPGLPQHSANVRLKYQHEKGHELALTLEASSELFLDYQNSESVTTPLAPSYGILHLSGKYQVNDTLNVYGGIRNLLDKDYINSVIIENVDASSFSPGDGFNFFAGIKLNF